MTRQNIPVPLGGGLDRESGILAANGTVMQDLRNVHILHGRLEGRKGLSRITNFGAGNTLLAIHPVRSRSLAFYIVLLADGRLELWQSAADGSGATALIDIPAAENTGAQRFVLADIYDKVFIAHDEPDILLRQPTRYWDFRTVDLHTLIIPSIGGANAKFRGVADHLSYMLGWGYGRGDDEDRPEMLRISIDGDPTTFDPNHYFIVGVRGEPITGGGAAGPGYAIKKLTSGRILVGTDRHTFGVMPIENYIGLPQHNLGISVNGTYYFWSATGPRRESGGQSEDLSPGLRLLDRAPDILAVIDLDAGFAMYDPTRNEVLFVFGKWAFVYHLATSPERWSYRQYAVALRCGAVLVESTSGALVVAPDPSYDFTLDTVQEGPPDPTYDFTLDAV